MQLYRYRRGCGWPGLVPACRRCAIGSRLVTSQHVRAGTARRLRDEAPCRFLPRLLAAIRSRARNNLKPSAPVAAFAANARLVAVELAITTPTSARRQAGWLAEKTNPGQQRISARKNCPMIRIHAVRAAVPGTGESDFHADDQQRAVRTGSLPAEAKAAITAFQAHHQGVISGRYHL